MTSPLRFLVETGVADPSSIQPVAWLGLVERAAASTIGATLRDGARALAVLLDKRRAELDEGQLSRARRLAHALLAASWKHTDAASGAPGWSLQCVLATVALDRVASETLLSRLLDEPTLPDRDASIKMLVSELPALLAMPALVGKLFRLVALDIASHEIAYDGCVATWHMQALDDLPGAGAVPQRAEHRWDGIRDHLEENAEAYLRAHPVDAAASIAAAIRGFWPTGDRPHELYIRSVVFPTAYWLTQDHLSHDLDGALTRHLVDAVVDRIDALPDTAEAMVTAMVAAQAPAPVWGRLVQRTPSTPVLATFLPELFRDPRNVRQLARSLSIALKGPEGLPAAAVDNLRIALSEFGSDELDVAIARQLRTAMDPSQATVPDVNEPLPSPDGPGTIWMLHHRGMSDEEISLPRNVAARSLQRAAAMRVAELRARIQNDRSPIEPASLSVYIDVARSLVRAADDVESPAQADDLWGTVAEIASLIARAGDPSVRDLLLAAAERPIAIEVINAQRPSNSLNGEAAYAAIEGLIALAICGDQEAVVRVRAVARAPLAGLRYVVARGIGALAPLGFWDELVAFVEREPNPAVFTWAVGELGAYIALDRARGLDLAAVALTRQFTIDHPDARAAVDRARAAALRHLTFAELRHGPSERPAVVAARARFFDQVEEHAEPIRSVLHAFHEWLLLEDDAGPGAADVRGRTWRFFDEVARRAVDAAEARRRDDSSFDVNARPRGEKHPLAETLERVSFWLYIAAGSKGANFEKPLANDAPRRAALVWRHGRRMLSRLAESGHLEAADHVLDTLAVLMRSAADVPGDGRRPVRRDVFVMFIDAMEKALDAGYAKDWRGMELFDNVIRWMLREHGEDVEASGRLGSISAITDRFLAVGWRQAYLLARDLELPPRA